MYDAFFGTEKKISLKNVDGKMRTLSIKVPKGIREGEKIRLIGQGKKGENGGKDGDLLIEIHIEKDRKFRLEGCDLITDLPLTVWEAALGSRINIQTIDGETTVYIPQGIKSGELIRIPNKGYQNGKGGRGDLVAEIKVMVPDELSAEEVKIFEKLKKISKFDPRN